MNLIKNTFAVGLVFGLLLAATPAKATIVEMETSSGTFRVNLFDRATPETVANFLDYLNSSQYTNSIIHRNQIDFVVQGGGFIYNGTLPLDSVTTTDPVVNEAVFSNVRGTIAMAKRGGDPNSATSQWFINLSDNSANLDIQNEGFTVFGQVIDDGMTVLDQIDELPKFDFGGSLTSVPLRNYTVEDFDSQENPGADNFVIVTSITIVDADVDSAANLEPVENTLIDTVLPTDSTPLTRRGGNFPIVGLLLLPLLMTLRKRNTAK